MSHYLISGGAGFIGSHLAEYISGLGHQVTVIDNLSTGSITNISGFHDRIRFVEGDILSRQDLLSVFKGVDYVLHQAAIPSVPRSIMDPLACHANNITGTLELLMAAKQFPVKRFVFASSSSVYGSDPSIPKLETQPTIPRSPYALSKLTGENYCRLFFELYGVPTVALRYFNVFGPRQNPDSQYAAVIPSFIKLLLHGKPPVIFSDGNQSRDFTFIDNVVQANVKACTSPAAPGKIYNIGCGSRTSIIHLFELISKIIGTFIKPVYSPERPGDVRNSSANINAASSDLGYEPSVNLIKGLQATIEYFKGLK
jgi:nucleoside-diphosphate-sugar epimerase